MDTITFNERSLEKSKYLIVLKDVSSSFVKLIPLTKKSDAIDKIEEWIVAMRNDPVYKCFSYPMVCHIKTDAAGEWSDDYKMWNERIGKSSLGVHMEYVTIVVSDVDAQPLHRGWPRRYHITSHHSL